MSNNILKPAFDGCDNCIVLSSNNEFMPVAAIMLHSIAKNSKKYNKYDIIILHEDITIFTQNAVIKLFNKNNISIRFYNISEYIAGKHFFTENVKSITIETYFRLLIPWILDDTYNRALYIDGDMIALKDIYDILTYDLGDNLIGAIRDYWGSWNCYTDGEVAIKSERRIYRESISLVDINEYVIAATIIFNLELFRKSYTANQVLSLALSKNWEQHDQDVLNILCKGKIKHISAVWGLLPDYYKIHNLPKYMQDEVCSAKEDPVIVHFGAKKKPWITPYVDYFLDFWKYAAETPFFKTLFEKIKSNEYKNYVAYALSVEKRGDIIFAYENNDIKRYFKGSSLGGLSSGHTKYRKINIEEGTLYLEGMVGFFGISLESDIKICLLINNNDIIKVSHQERENGFHEKAQLYTFRGEAFSFSYKLDPAVSTYNIKIMCYLDGLPLEKTNLGFEEFCPLSRQYKHSYCQYGEWVVTTDGRILSIKHINLEDGKGYETAFLKELIKTKKSAYIKAAHVRVAARLLKPVIKKPIWLISDKLFQDDEKGTAVLRDISQSNGADIVFVISEGNTDFKKLEQYGRIIKAYSAKHKMLTLLADVSISSITDKEFRNPFKKYSDAYKDLMSKVRHVLYN